VASSTNVNVRSVGDWRAGTTLGAAGEVIV